MGFLVPLIFLIFSSLNSGAMTEQSIKSWYSAQNCLVEKKMVFLDKKAKAQIKDKTGLKGLGAIVKSFYIDCQGQRKSRVFALSDIIRTHSQGVLVEVDGVKIKSLKVKKFSEPHQYKASESYLKKFKNRSDFKGVDALTGATLTRASLIRLSKTALELSKQ